MANKYLRHGETYCGDGTTSAAATSNGGVGAWNDINVMEGTAPAYGALVAGDVVYIRSKDSAGADITRTLTASLNLGSATATATNPIAWVLDNGTVWSGINGVLTYTSPNSAWYCTLLVNNIIEAKTQDAWVLKSTVTGPSDYQSLALIKGVGIGLLFDASAKTSSSVYCLAFDGGAPRLERPHIKIGAMHSLAGSGFITGANVKNNVVTLIDPDIEMTSTSSLGGSLFYGQGDISAAISFVVIGGRVRGPGAGSSTALVRLGSTNGRFIAVGLSVPVAMPVTPASTAFYSGASSVDMTSSDGLLGGHYERTWGFATGRTDNNPPTLSAQIPDSAGADWAWRVYPRNPDELFPMCVGPTVKVFTDAAAEKTISLEFLVATTLLPTKRNVWMTVEYTDNATGLPKHISTRDFSAGALDSSDANWTATTWGLVTLNKRKLSCVTPTEIKRNTPVIVTLWGTAKSATANDILFVDPDFGIN